ncbi:MAG: protein-L-isoaspartate O-methyltransferase [Hydrogenophilales bacterium CG17_big_fil_post_rev_8_21_14_2_50_63_12]|nr:MAG: protein-L-isoaspartate O-methyltransferase [Hydrogenophilales bacterium CG17_big_fil_post_rev_8_21_14_2_50_63_12]PIX96703.1 MAG: protein-L-isoaspartate O-methyltransferase [Hydrogenophilales bacterium CG_4_10_14_3_um_filter_63_21]PJB02510.1 MAG: protein-L-isoaspartate O-methyltransferase [Hydrogenophilales bacterium CG_4_9_14_3_um_filter_63_34]
MTPSPEMQALLDEIRAEVRATRQYTGRAALSARVLDAFAEVPRHAFLPDALRLAAYANRPLPIGHQQTISQPYIVALMTDLLDPEADGRVLEIGTGSGYQAAVLSKLVKQVYTLEVVAALAEQASERLRRLGYGNVEVRQGDGHAGWPEHAPYDGIIVTAAAPEVPPVLIEQLKPGGRLLIPVGNRYSGQELLLIEKDRHGRLRQESVLPVIFVPLTGAAET